MDSVCMEWLRQDCAPSTASCQVFCTTGRSQSVGAKEQDYHRQTSLDKWDFLTLMNDWIIYLGIPSEWGWRRCCADHIADGAFLSARVVAVWHSTRFATIPHRLPNKEPSGPSDGWIISAPGLQLQQIHPLIPSTLPSKYWTNILELVLIWLGKSLTAFR